MIAIVGDMHWGIKNNSPKYLEFQEKWFLEELLPVAKTCSNVVILGDFFENRVALNPIILQTVRKLFKELSSITKVHAILGNHDIYFRNNCSVHWLSILEDQGVIVYDKPTETIIEGKKCLMLPWIVPETIKEVEKLLTENKYDICYGHLEICGFELVKGIKEEKGFNKALFNNCKKVYSGHFHLARKEGNINYVGTPYETTWNDYKEEKSFIVLDGEKESSVITKNCPKHIKLNSSDKITKELVSNNIIRLKILEMNDIERLKLLEKINSYEPLLLTVDEENYVDLDTDQELENNIKDTIGFLTEYVNIIEIPEGLEKKIILEKIEELYKKTN